MDPCVSVKEECGGPGGGGGPLPFDDFKEEDLKGDLGDFGNGDYHSDHKNGGGKGLARPTYVETKIVQIELEKIR